MKKSSLWSAVDKDSQEIKESLHQLSHNWNPSLITPSEVGHTTPLSPTAPLSQIQHTASLVPEFREVPISVTGSLEPRTSRILHQPQMTPSPTTTTTAAPSTPDLRPQEWESADSVQKTIKLEPRVRLTPRHPLMPEATFSNQTTTLEPQNVGLTEPLNPEKWHPQSPSGWEVRIDSWEESATREHNRQPSRPMPESRTSKTSDELPVQDDLPHFNNHSLLLWSVVGVGILVVLLAIVFVKST